MAWVKLAAEGVTWASWVWHHREAFRPALCGADDFAAAALADPEGLVRRVGSAIVFGRPAGGEQVLAFIEQAAPRLETIQGAVDGLQAGQSAAAASLASLQCVSMVTLGASALAPAVLALQFAALHRKLTALQSQVAGLHAKFDAAQVARLRAGLELLRLGRRAPAGGDAAEARRQLQAALPPCRESLKYFAVLLRRELDDAKAVRDGIRLLARHLTVALAGVACCHVGLEQDREAFGESEVELGLLRESTRRVFRETVGRDPAAYLMSDLRARGVTLEFLSGLFRQAYDAGTADASEAASASAWFEAHHAAIVRARRPWTRRGVERLCAALAEAVAAVEEMNRIVGLTKLVAYAAAAGRTTQAFLDERARDAAGFDGGADPFAACVAA